MITRRLARPLSALSTTQWTCPSCTRASFLQQRLPTSLSQRRKVHGGQLTHNTTFESDGIPGLLSHIGYRISWTIYQTMIMNKLNELTAGETTNSLRPKDIVIQYARDPMNASLFNHASMAHNNHFFFEGLSTYPTELDKFPQLKQSLEKTFGSIQTLQATMLDTAAAMFGPGFVWLVWARDTGNVMRSGDWRILTTYLAGTPYPEAGYRQQGLDMNSSNSATYEAYKASQPMNSVGAFGVHSASGQAHAKIPPGGTSLMPVLCVNTWEHVYLYDFGVQGKRKYLADWWDAIAWQEVEAKANSAALPGMLRGR